MPWPFSLHLMHLMFGFILPEIKALCKVFVSLYKLISFQSMVAHLSFCCESKLWDSPGLYRCMRRGGWLFAVQVLYENAFALEHLSEKNSSDTERYLLLPFDA